MLLAGVAWRIFGSRGAGETLVRALSRGDEQNRMLAGMALIKAGERTLDLIEQKVTSGEGTPELVRLLPDLDAPRARALLEQLDSGASGALAETARQCLVQLRRMDDFSRSERSD